MPLDEVAMVDCEGVVTMLVSLGSTTVLMGVDTGPDEEEGDSSNTMEETREDKITALVLKLVVVVLSDWTEVTTEVAAVG